MHVKKERFLEHTLPSLCVWLLAAIILGSIVYYRPYWGLMDDAYNIFKVYGDVTASLRENFFAYLWNYGVADLSWGMFRPTYPLVVLFVYPPGIWWDPWAAYFWNAILCFGLIWFYTKLLSTALELPQKLIILCCAAFFYAHDLLQHLSLQEKLLHLAAIIFIYICANFSKWGAIKFWTFFALSFVFGFMVKASFTIHFCIAYVFLFSQALPGLRAKQAKSWFAILVVTSLGVLMVLFYAYISKQGGYTRSYSYTKVLPNLTSIHGVLFFLPAAMSLAYWATHFKQALQSPVKLAPVVGVLAFLALFLPWGIQGYIQTVIAPVYAALIVQLAFQYQRLVSKQVWIPLLCCAAVIVTCYRMVGMYSRLSDIRMIVQNAPGYVEQGIRDIYMPCEEGNGAVQLFIEHSGIDGLKFHFLAPSDSLANKFVLRDSSMCKLRVDFPKNCSEETIFAGKLARGYHLTKVSCI